jgi:hypothetical protein
MQKKSDSWPATKVLGLVMVISYFAAIFFNYADAILNGPKCGLLEDQFGYGLWWFLVPIYLLPTIMLSISVASKLWRAAFLFLMGSAFSSEYFIVGFLRQSACVPI